MVRRCFTNRSANVIIPIYTSLIRPILETNSSAWNPWLKKDIDALERVQRRCEKLCTESLTFESLHERRYRADMRETFKLLKNAYKQGSYNFSRTKFHDISMTFSMTKVTFSRTHKNDCFR